MLGLYLGWIDSETLVQACHFVRPGYNTYPLGESSANGYVHSDCGNGGLCSIGASTGWAHAYQEGADCILRTLHAATKSIWWIMFQAFANECAVLLMLVRIAFMVSLCI